MNTSGLSSVLEFDPIWLRRATRAGFGLATLLAFGACDTGELDAEIGLEERSVESDGADPFHENPDELRAPEGELPVSETSDFCHKLEVNVADCRGNFVNGIYTWNPQKGYQLQKQWEDYVFSDYVKASESEPVNWAIVYEGFHRNGDWHPAYTEVAKATGPGLPDEARWPDGVTVRCVQ